MRSNRTCSCYIACVDCRDIAQSASEIVPAGVINRAGMMVNGETMTLEHDWWASWRLGHSPRGVRCATLPFRLEAAAYGCAADDLPVRVITRGSF